MYTLSFTPIAIKVLRKIPKNTATLIRDKLDILAQDPYAPNPNVKKLQGRPGYRLRVGDWRVFYRLHNEQLEIIIMKIAPRGGAYKK
ncbi:Plasmid stabilization system [Beggiatoa sp. PS]|nr:Plasmid stabilization system [Beggiatoa sp. PS]